VWKWWWKQKITININNRNHEHRQMKASTIYYSNGGSAGSSGGSSHASPTIIKRAIEPVVAPHSGGSGSKRARRIPDRFDGEPMTREEQEQLKQALKNSLLESQLIDRPHADEAKVYK